MAFNVGDTVVYPHHGAAVIESVEIRKVKGEDREYLVLRVAQGDLTVRVPSDNVDLVGVRDVVNADGLERVFNVLRQPYTEEPTNWSRRYKAWPVGRREAHAGQGTSDSRQRACSRREDRRGQG